jgi:hypothetical protein
MTTPATAFAPGSPAAKKSIVDGAIGAAMSGMGISIPGLTQNTSSRSGDILSGERSTGDGFNVNFGNGVSQGGAAIPVWVWIAVAAGVGLWAWKKFT